MKVTVTASATAQTSTDISVVSNGIDDSHTLQAALDSAYASNVPVSLASGTYLTSTLIYKGQTLLGSGWDKTIIKGKPGHDVFLVQDPALGGLSFLPEFFRVSDLQIQVDSSVSNVFNRPIFPIKE